MIPSPVRVLAGGAAVCPSLAGTLVPRRSCRPSSPAVGVDPAVSVRPVSRPGCVAFLGSTPAWRLRPGPWVPGPPDAHSGLDRPWPWPGRLRGGGRRVVEGARPSLRVAWDPRALGAVVRRAPLGKVSAWPGSAGPRPSVEQSGSIERDRALGRVHCHRGRGCGGSEVRRPGAAERASAVAGTRGAGPRS